MSIYIHSENTSHRISNINKVKKCCRQIIEDNKMIAENVNIIITDDKTLLDINKSYLNRNYYTDVISFIYSDHNKLEGDVFISIDTVKDNASKFNIAVDNELLRIIIHGVLHLVGFEDNSDVNKELMHNLEDYYLSKFGVS